MVNGDGVINHNEFDDDCCGGDFVVDDNAGDFVHNDDGDGCDFDDEEDDENDGDDEGSPVPTCQSAGGVLTACPCPEKRRRL